MSDTVVDPIDLDALTDDQVNELGPEQIQALMVQEDQEIAEVDVQTEPQVDDTSSDVPEDVPESNDVPETTEPSTPEQGVDEESTDTPSEDVDKTPAPEDDPSQSPEGSEEVEDAPKKEEAPKEEDTKPDDKPKSKEDTDSTVAKDFFTKITAPFKADGRDMVVKTPEEAVRLMQMGANYSRRMQEIKPLKIMQATLADNGLDDPKKLDEMIDLFKGTPAAINKFLRDRKIDPLDLDITKDTDYSTPSYEADGKDVAFKEAIDNTMKAPGGQSLIADINQNWDVTSKEALRDQPEIFENVLAQREAGVYSQIEAEVQRQKTLGFLLDIPFLHAYHQVGDAMQKAGVFSSTEQVHSKGADDVPIDTGTRKAAPKPKTEQPNPNLSSTPPTASGNPASSQNEPDYSSMSDADFLKLEMPG